jgi:hypothetical protein
MDEVNLARSSPYFGAASDCLAQPLQLCACWKFGLINVLQPHASVSRTLTWVSQFGSRFSTAASFRVSYPGRTLAFYEFGTDFMDI